MNSLTKMIDEDQSPSLHPNVRGPTGNWRRTQVSGRPRCQFRRIVLTLQVLVSMALLSLPEVLGLASRTMTLTKSMNNLSPVESLLLASRLKEIKSGIQEDYYSVCSETGARTYIFPGAGGVDELVLELQESKPNSVVVDWKEYRGSILTASFDSEAVGETIAEIVLDNMEKMDTGEDDNKTDRIQFIGISVGAFAANAAATLVHRHVSENKRKNADDTRSSTTNWDVHLVLLDPFCGRGVFGPNYGRDNFGKHATTALQILNTDDPVPTTNDSLPLCFCLDVTDAPEKQDFVLLPGDSMHSWPLAYYARHYNDTDTSDSESSSVLLPRGKVEIVS